MDENDPMVKTAASAFDQALADLGWTYGRNVWADTRWGGGDINRIRALAQELVGLQPDIIVTSGTPATAAVQRETRTIPIVFVGAADPVATGIVPRLNQPGGNVTGFANFEPSMGGKWLELLTEIAPGLKRATIMFNPDTAPVSTFMPSFETAARSLKLTPIIASVHSDAEIETAITVLGREPGGGLVVVPGGFMAGHQAPIISAAARNNVPAVFWSSDFAKTACHQRYQWLRPEHPFRGYDMATPKSSGPGQFSCWFPTSRESPRPCPPGRVRGRLQG
jgi:putative ABC transport system substrate-binding protein